MNNKAEYYALAALIAWTPLLPYGFMLAVAVVLTIVAVVSLK